MFYLPLWHLMMINLMLHGYNAYIFNTHWSFASITKQYDRDSHRLLRMAKTADSGSLAPDRELFKSFYVSSSGPTGITLDQLRRHDDLSLMIGQVIHF